MCNMHIFVTESITNPEPESPRGVFWTRHLLFFKVVFVIFQLKKTKVFVYNGVFLKDTSLEIGFSFHNIGWTTIIRGFEISRISKKEAVFMGNIPHALIKFLN